MCRKIVCVEQDLFEEASRSLDVGTVPISEGLSGTIERPMSLLVCWLFMGSSVIPLFPRLPKRGALTITRTQGFETISFGWKNAPRVIIQDLFIIVSAAARY